MCRYVAVAALCLAATAAPAGELPAMAGQSIDLGQFHGIVHYTIEPDGYRVVATLASGAEDPPIRFVSTLGPGQRMLISVPRRRAVARFQNPTRRECSPRERFRYRGNR
jgi:hypothetical protein